MKRILSFSALFLVVSFSLACGSSGTSEPVKVGSSCKGMDAAAAYACDGKKVLFCSSMTDFKYQKQSECKKKQTCELNADKTVATCK